MPSSVWLGAAAFALLLPVQSAAPDLSRHFVGVDGTFVLLNGRTNEYMRFNTDRANQRFAPCSTFKIPHTAILLETGTAPDADYEVKYDPSYNQPSQWARDFTLKTAFDFSAMWYYQVLARRAGMTVEQQFVHQFAYGNEDPHGGKIEKMGEPFWLDGTLRVSANEQVEFLRRFYERRLGLSDRTTTITKQIMIAEDTPRGRLSAKTGACQPPSGEDTANWYVGYVEKDGDVYYFALEMGDKDFGRAYSERVPTTRAILSELGILTTARSSAQATDAWAGTWVLNLAKSTYELGPAPKSAVSRLEPSGDSWKLSQDTVDAQGTSAHVETTVQFDGKDYPVSGVANTTWAFTRVDDHTYTLIAKRGGIVTATARTVVSADGRTRTTTTTGTNAQGQAVKNAAVYERQP